MQADGLVGGENLQCRQDLATTLLFDEQLSIQQGGSEVARDAEGLGYNRATAYCTLQHLVELASSAIPERGTSTTELFISPNQAEHVFRLVGAMQTSAWGKHVSRSGVLGRARRIMGAKQVAAIVHIGKGQTTSAQIALVLVAMRPDVVQAPTVVCGGAIWCHRTKTGQGQRAGKAQAKSGRIPRWLDGKSTGSQKRQKTGRDAGTREPRTLSSQSSCKRTRFKPRDDSAGD